MSTTISHTPARRRSTALQAQSGPSSGRAWLQYGLTVLVFAVLFTFWRVAPVPDSVHLAAILVWAVSLFPIARWRATGQRGMPIFEMVCLAYGIQYSLPVYLQTNSVSVWIGSVQVSWDDTLQALLLTALGIGAMIAAFYAGRRIFASRLPRVDLRLDTPHRFAYILLGLGMGLTLQALQSGGLSVDNTSGSAAFVRVLASQAYVALVLLAYAVYTRQAMAAFWRLLLYGSTAVLLLLGMSTGSLESALVPLALLLIVYWHATRKLPVRWLLVGLLLFVLLNAVKNDYRAEVRSGAIAPGVTSRVRAWADLAVRRLELAAQGDPASAGQGIVQDSTGRLDLVHIFAHVHGLTPSVIPYYSGRTYSYLASAWIPRFLWPDKPEAQSASGGTDVDYGLKYPNDTSTSIGLGQPAEAYANFGLAGVFLVLALQGLFYALLDSVFNGPESDGGRAVYLSVMIFFLNGIGTGTAILFGAVIQNTVAGTLLLKGASRWAPLGALPLPSRLPGSALRHRTREGGRSAQRAARVGSTQRRVIPKDAMERPLISVPGSRGSAEPVPFEESRYTE